MRVVEVYRNIYSPLLKSKGLKSNRVSEMPCRLNDDLHEWRNEVAIVPN